MPELKCPKCGGEIQGTVKTYLSVIAGRLIVQGINTDDATWYCENDHIIDPVRHPRLVNELIKLASPLDAFGRPPGWGELHLDVLEAAGVDHLQEGLCSQD